MKFYCMTITGADDSVDPNELVAISEEFRFVEWGILFSPERQGNEPRYPSLRWLEKFYSVIPAHLNRAAHVCGQHARDILFDGYFNDNHDAFRRDHLDNFSRIQVNGFGKYMELQKPSEHLCDVLQRKDRGRYIMQVQEQGSHAAKLAGALEMVFGSNVEAIYDPSGGTGLSLGASYPNRMMQPPFTNSIVMAYAGGINVSNVRTTVKRIKSEFDYFTNHFSLDMETGARSDDGVKFDLSKCVAVLKEVAPLLDFPPKS